MSEPTIICPKCKAEIKLTESLAAPLVESIKTDYEERLTKKDSDMARREALLREQKEALSKAKDRQEEEIEETLKQERAAIAASEARKAKIALGAELEEKSKALTDLQEILTERDKKLAKAQEAQVELIKKQRELDDAKREMELTIENRIQESLAATRDKARKEVEGELKLKVAEKEQTITSMQKQIEDLKRRAEQGSQQLQGEVLELELEKLLGAQFPFDNIEPVPKGEFGGDTLQRIVNANAQPCGTILWETKRTKNWSDGWLTKLRNDQRTAKAEIAVLISQALPKDVDTFAMVDGIWVTHPRAAIPVATILRNSLIEVASSRQAVEGQQTKTDLIYHYLTGPRFKQRVEAAIRSMASFGSFCSLPRVSCGDA